MQNRVDDVHLFTTEHVEPLANGGVEWSTCCFCQVSELRKDWKSKGLRLGCQGLPWHPPWCYSKPPQRLQHITSFILAFWIHVFFFILYTFLSSKFLPFVSLCILLLHLISLSDIASLCKAHSLPGSWKPSDPLGSWSSGPDVSNSIQKCHRDQTSQHPAK